MILVEDDTLSYPTVVNGVIQNVSFRQKDVQSARYNNEDEDFIVVTNDFKEYTFDKTYFSKVAEFERFRGLFRKNRN